MRKQHGFTLIEVLVALVIVALGMSALFETLGSAADTSTWLRDKTFAQWIAFNQLELTRLSGSAPTDGTSDGELDYAGRHWRWRQEVTSPGFPGVFQIDVRVEHADTSTVDESAWITTVTGGMGAAISPQQLQSLYPDPGQAAGSGASSAPTSAPASAPTSSSPSSFFAPASAPSATPAPGLQ